ncbi:hypothetical protein cyc_01751 [Cyclospora cayetanensis]|uniref:Uncharacterized protein n=1 Tax=Cyclospora cayetanensis TaxID=88456 RepID=A0A1D3CS45_9EIME|nr:hypothetical protein cyc_01751 [Cyclospora cayetanensis]
MNASDVLKLISSAVCCVHLLEALFRDSTVHGLRAGPSSGPLHLDSYGRPVHLAEPGRIWNVSPSAQGTGVLSASLPETPSVTIPGSTEPNLHYGTLQLKDGTVLDRSPTVPAASSASFQPVQVNAEHLDRKTKLLIVSRPIYRIEIGNRHQIETPSHFNSAVLDRVQGAVALFGRQMRSVRWKGLYPGVSSAAASYLSSERDYTHTCPEYWRFDEPSGTCQPPKVLVKRAQEDAEHAEELALMWQSYTGSYRDTGEIRRMAAPERLAGLFWRSLPQRLDKRDEFRSMPGTVRLRKTAPSVQRDGSQHEIVKKEMLKSVCEVECPPAETWEPAGISSVATSSNLLEGTASTSEAFELPVCPRILFCFSGQVPHTGVTLG